MFIHWPIVQTAAAAVAALVIVTVAEAPSLSRPGALELFAFVAGLLYTQLFEHAVHRFPMHRRIRFLEGVRMNHLKHHRVFNGARFKTSRPEDRGHIAGLYWIFPVLLLAHYTALSPFLSENAVVWFLAAATAHYVLFEVSHWFTHIENNALDRALEKIPVVSRWRANQIEHHRLHHEVPEIAFNFNPPYLGDRLTRRMPRHAAALGFTFPELSPPATAPAEGVIPTASRPASNPVPALTFWQRPAVRTASAVAAGMAGIAVIGAAVFLARSVAVSRELTVDSGHLTVQTPS